MNRTFFVSISFGLLALLGAPATAQTDQNPAMNAPDQVAWQLFIQANLRAGGSNSMKRVFDLIDGAKQAVLFLAFDPGNNSILDAAGRALAKNPDLFVRGALTNAQRATNFSTALHQGGGADQDDGGQHQGVTVVGEPGKPKKKGTKLPSAKPDFRAVPAGMQRWRGFSAIAGLMAACLVGIVLVREYKPEVLPPELRPHRPVQVVTQVVEKPVEVVKEVVREVPAPRPAQFVAAFQKDEQSPAFLLTVDVDKRMSEAFGVRYNPHVWGTGIAIAASLQLLAVLPSHTPTSLAPLEPMLEFDRTEHPIRQAVLKEPIEHQNGVVRVPDGPGLGVEIDRAALARFATD